MRWLLVLFVTVPLVELYLLVFIGSQVGFWPTFALTFISGTLGSYLAKREGIKVWREWKLSLAQFKAPEQGVIDGVLVLVGATLLIAPGILTDLVGLSLLVPSTRRRLAVRVRRAIDRRIASGQLRVMDVRVRGGGWAPPAPVLETQGETLGDGAPNRQSDKG